MKHTRLFALAGVFLHQKCVNKAIKIMIGIGIPRNNSNSERMIYLLMVDDLGLSQVTIDCWQCLRRYDSVTLFSAQSSRQTRHKSAYQ